MKTMLFCGVAALTAVAALRYRLSAMDITTEWAT